MKSSSEKIRERIAELESCFHEATERGCELVLAGCVTALKQALELVEAQEREEQWVSFDEQRPPNPTVGEKRLLLINCEYATDPAALLWARPCGIGEREWLSGDGAYGG